MEWKIESEYIKNKIKGQSFRSTKLKRYIDDLIFLEKSITKGIPCQWSVSYKLHVLKSEYQTEYEELLKELKPKEYKKYIKKKELERLQNEKEHKRWNEEKKRRLKREKQWWLSIGGKA